MSVKNTDTHPSAISDSERAEMDKLLQDEVSELDGDDEAGDTDDTGGDEGLEAGAAEAEAEAGAAGDKKADGGAPADKVDAAAGAAVAEAAGDKGAAAGEGEAAGDAAPGQQVTGDTVTRKQYDGVLSELREVRSSHQALKAAITTPREALPPRDFDAEDKTLDAKVSELDLSYEKDGLTDEEYRSALRDIERERRTLDRERNKYELVAQLESERAAREAIAEKEAADQAKKDWVDGVTAWESSKGDWLKNPVRRSTVNQTMEMMEADPEISKLDNVAFLAKLEEYLGEAFADFPKTGKAAAGAGDGTIDPRRQLAAARAAEVGAAPPRIEGGVGNRGTRTEDIDLETMPLGKFGKLPESKQNELMGLD